MTIHDPISDLLTRVRNASSARHRYVDVPWSNVHENIATVLKENGFIEQFLVKEEDKKSTMRIFLRYSVSREPVIRGLKRVSSPGCRRYIGYSKIPRVFNGMGISILSTSKGVLAGKEARSSKVGGELLCYVW